VKSSGLTDTREKCPPSLGHHRARPRPHPPAGGIQGHEQHRPKTALCLPIPATKKSDRPPVSPGAAGAMVWTWSSCPVLRDCHVLINFRCSHRSARFSIFKRRPPQLHRSTSVAAGVAPPHRGSITFSHTPPNTSYLCKRAPVRSSLACSMAYHREDERPRSTLTARCRHKHDRRRHFPSNLLAIDSHPTPNCVLLDNAALG